MTTRREFLKVSAWACSVHGLVSCGKHEPSAASTAPDSSGPPLSAIARKVVAIVSRQLDVGTEKIKPETRFIDDLGADSLDVVELVMDLEEQFDMSIPDEDAGRLRTVGDVIAYVEKKASTATR